MCAGPTGDAFSYMVSRHRHVVGFASNAAQHLHHRGRHGFHTSSRLLGSHLPAQVDLLERYQSLVTLGKIAYHEDQVRMVIQLRNLQRELAGYAPPALSVRLLQTSITTSSGPAKQEDEQPWWKFSPDEEEIDREVKAIVTHKSHAEEIASLTTPKGLLITGPPGSGKSFLVDLWYSTLPAHHKARKHYNQLVLEIYRSVWEETQRRMHAQYTPSLSPDPSSSIADSKGRAPWNVLIRDHWRNLVLRNKLPSKWTRYAPFSKFGYADTTIAFTVAKRLVLRHWLLVFDEIQLLDVSSAGLLSDVLSWYWRMGGIIVGTSNKVPDDLYKNGVQRERLEPFVEALKARCPVVELDVKRDWREEIGKQPDLGQKTWFTENQKESYKKLISQLTSSQLATPTRRDLNVFGRKLHVPWAHGTICRFSFAELCEQDLGAADYLTLSSTFSHIIITSVPVLPLSSKNQARRFISLIDALYESRCKLICLAEALPESIFFPASTTPQIDTDLMLAESITESQEYYRPNVSSYDSPQMQTEVAQKADGMGEHKKDTASLEELSIFSGKDEQFAFKRALSRIQEMTSVVYNNNQDGWMPLPADERKWELNSMRPAGSLVTGQCQPEPSHRSQSPHVEGYIHSQHPEPESLNDANRQHHDQQACIGSIRPSSRKSHAQQGDGPGALDLGHYQATYGARSAWGREAGQAISEPKDGTSGPENGDHGNDNAATQPDGVVNVSMSLATAGDVAGSRNTNCLIDSASANRRVVPEPKAEDATGIPHSYSPAEAMVNRPFAPRIHPRHVWGVSEESSHWPSQGQRTGNEHHQIESDNVKKKH